jgi:hypothetical protein
MGTMLDVGLVVLGSVLLGLAIAVLLDGFDLVHIGLGLSTGAMLGSGLVIGIVGAFALGVASEGPLGRGRRLVGYDEVEVLVARVVAAVVVGLLLFIAHGYLVGPAADLPLPFQVGVDGIRAVAIAGMTAVPVVGVPLAWWARSGYLGESIAVDADIPLLYLVWAVATMIIM